MKRRTLFLKIGFLAMVTTLMAWSTESADAAEAGPVKFETAVDRPVIHHQSKDTRVVVRIDLEGVEKKAKRKRTPLNLAVVLDRSGSMRGSKLEQAKQAAAMLVDQLDKSDVFALVIYDTEVETLIPAQKVGSKRKEFHRAISRIQTGGSTALYDGVKQGGAQLREYLKNNRLNRVMLLSDGIANVGPSSNREIAQLGHQLAREEISVTTIGLGNDYNENLMTALAEASDANYYYVADVEQLPGVFQSELGELKSLVARNIVVEVQCPDGVKPIRFLGRPESLKKSQKASVKFNTLASEQVRQLYLECQLDEGSIGQIDEIVEVSLRYEDSPEESGTGVSPGLHQARKSVTLAYTEDRTKEEEAVDQDIVAQAIIFANASETEKAIALADQGNVAACREQLHKQQVTLGKALAVAPASQKSAIQKELDAVQEAESDLEANQRFSKVNRKALQSGVFKLRNSK